MADRTLTPDEIRVLANRLAAAAASVKVARPLRTDLTVAVLLIRVLLRTGIIAGPINLEEGDHGK
jgi:hypothetical protein